MIIHVVLLPWWLLTWYGIALLAANVTTAAPIPQRPAEWAVIGSIVVTVFGLGVGLWIWIFRILKRWSRNGLTGGWAHSVVWAALSALLTVFLLRFRGIG
jgi:hypothetical protein